MLFIFPWKNDRAYYRIGWIHKFGGNMKKLFLSLFALLFIGTAIAADPMFVESRHIDKRDDSATTAKNKGMDEARRDIVSTIFYRFGDSKKLNELLPSLSNSDIAALVGATNIDNEKQSQTSYVADVTMTVARESMINWMRKNDVPYTMIKSKKPAYIQMLSVDQFADNSTMKSNTMNIIRGMDSSKMLISVGDKYVADETLVYTAQITKMGENTKIRVMNVESRESRETTILGYGSAAVATAIVRLINDFWITEHLGQTMVIVDQAIFLFDLPSGLRSWATLRGQIQKIETDNNIHPTTQTISAATARMGVNIDQRRGFENALRAFGYSVTDMGSYIRVSPRI